MTKFKVGDKVKIISVDFEVKGDLQKKDIGTTCKITTKDMNDGEQIYLLDNNYYGANFPENSLELVEENTKFKVGDKVVRNGVERKLGDYSITNKGGGVMEVISIVGCKEIRLETSCDGSYNVEGKYFSLVEENIESKGGKKMTEFKVGDRVRILDNADGDASNYRNRCGVIINERSDEDYSTIKLDSGEEINVWDGSGRNLEIELESITEQKNKMKDIKKFDKKAISEAVKEIDEERLDRQKENAKEMLREIYSKKDTAEESKEKVSDELKDINKELNDFTKLSK